MDRDGRRGDPMHIHAGDPRPGLFRRRAEGKILSQGAHRSTRCSPRGAQVHPPTRSPRSRARRPAQLAAEPTFENEKHATVGAPPSAHITEEGGQFY